MRLEGSCHCRAVRFSLESADPVPYQRCYCSICRKTQGSGGYAVNLAGDADTLEVRSNKHLRTYHAVLRDGGDERRSESEWMFCGICGSHLWLFDPGWPALLHPLASAIDTTLAAPPQRTHMMLDHAAAWCQPAIGADDRRHGEYPDESIAAWHERLGLGDRD